MKKLFLALLVTVMSFTFIAKASAADPSTGYTWVDQYRTDGKTLMLPHGAVKTDFVSYGYSGVDVLLGNYAMPLAKGQVLAPNATMGDPDVKGWASLATLYVNPTEQTWYVTRAAVPGYVMIFIDKDGEVYSIMNSHVFFNNAQFDASQTFNIWWADGALQSRGGVDLAPKNNVDFQLKYSDLGTTYHWLTKATVDAAKATGVTFADTDLLYKDASGKYTNVATGNTPVMNDLTGYEIPAGGAMLSIQYLEYVDFMPQLKEFYTLVNGQDHVASLVEHDMTGPAIRDHATGLTVGSYFKYAQGAVTLPTIDVVDYGKFTDGTDDSNPALTTAYTVFNPSTKAWDTVAAIDNTSAPGHYKVVYSAQDAATTPNKTSVTSYVDITTYNSPVFTGVKNQTINQGAAFTPTTGITVTDGYNYSVTPVVFTDLNVNVPGVYTVLLTATNIYGVTATTTYTVTVLDTTKPVVLIPSPVVVVEVGAELSDAELTSHVFGVDNVAGALKYTMVDNGGVDVNDDKANVYADAGTYTITVQVSDAAGNKVNVTYDLEVVAKDLTSNSEITKISDAVADLQSATDTLKSQVTGLSASINDVKAALQDSLNTAVATLDKSLDSLKTKTADKDQNGLIISVVVGVVALAGVGVAGFGLKKK